MNEKYLSEVTPDKQIKNIKKYCFRRLERNLKLWGRRFFIPCSPITKKKFIFDLNFPLNFLNKLYFLFISNSTMIVNQTVTN